MPVFFSGLCSCRPVPLAAAVVVVVVVVAVVVVVKFVVLPGALVRFLLFSLGVLLL
jgi:hypothetical protein